MKLLADIADAQVAALLKRGAIGVIPTDTLYGVVASTAHPEAIKRLYNVRRRSSLKGCITLAADAQQILGQAAWSVADQALVARYWPGPVSIVLPSPGAPAYLHPVDGTLAYRVPADEGLRTLLRQTGPLFAPSANPAGEKPAATIAEAQHYFGNGVDFYVDGGDLSGKQPSALIRQKDGQTEVLRGSLPPEDS